MCISRFYLSHTFFFFFFFFNDPATTEIYTLSLHDALPIFESHSVSGDIWIGVRRGSRVYVDANTVSGATSSDRKSTRLNSSHANISYAVFCLKKKKKKQKHKNN